MVVVGCALGLGIAAPLLTATPDSYRAESLVVARQLQLDPVALPSYARSVFDSDALLQLLLDRTGGSDGPALAGRLELVPDGANAWGVRARAADPGAAARLADVAAQAYVDELNKNGSDVGTFTLQRPAAVPTAVSPQGRPAWLTGLLGVLAGALLGAALISLLVAARRPVLGEREVASAVRQPLIGVVVLPATRPGRAPDPASAPGLLPVARALMPLVDASVVLVSTPRATAARPRLLILLAMALAPIRDVFVSGSPEVVSSAEQALGSAVADVTAAGRSPRPGLELVDGGAPLETVEVPQWPLPLVLVVRYGESSATLRRLAAEHIGEEILGVVLVEEGERSSDSRWSRPVPTQDGRTHHEQVTQAGAG